MRGPPRVRMVSPWVGARLHGDQPVAAGGVRQQPPGTGEVRVERRRVPVDVVVVPAGGVRLPDLEQRLRHRPAVLVHHAAVDDDPLAERLARVLARRSGSPRRSRPRRGAAPPGANSRAAARAASSAHASPWPRSRGRGRWVGVVHVAPPSWEGAQRGGLRIGGRRRLAQVVSDAERPAGRGARASAAVRPGGPRRGELAIRFRLEHAQVGDDGSTRRPGSSGSRAARRTCAALSQHHEDLPRAHGDLGAPPPPAAAPSGARSRRSPCCSGCRSGRSARRRGSRRRCGRPGASRRRSRAPRRPCPPSRPARRPPIESGSTRRLRADRAALVDEHAAGRVGARARLQASARQADADEADGPVAEQPARRRHGHHLVGCTPLTATRRHALYSARPPCRARAPGSRPRTRPGRG